MFGWDDTEVMGLSLDHLHLVPEGFEVEHKELIRGLLQGNNIPAYRTVRKKREGGLLHVSTSYSPLKGENGQIVGLIGIYRDITEQIEKELQIEEVKQRYQSLVVHHPDAVFEFDMNGHCTGANHALEQVTGYTWEELMYVSFVPLVAPEKLNLTLENFESAAKGETRNYESAIYNKKGERIELDVTNIPIIVNEQITGVFGIAKNITEHKRIQHELIQTKETLESFVHNTLDAIDIVDLNERITDINPAFESMYGYTEEEVIGKNFSLIIPEHEQYEENILQEVLNGTVIHDVEVVRERKDGSLIDVSLSLSPIRNAKGEITSVAEISRDISEKKKAARMIQESEERYRLIANNMTDLIALLRADLTILYTSPSHKTVLGISLSEGNSFPSELFHEDDLEHVFFHFKKVLETNEQGRVEYRLKHGEGHFVWLDTRITPVNDESGEFLHVLCVSRDITERKQYESELEKMAFYDYLTGASNRRLFMDRLNHMISQVKRYKGSFVVMSLDFDRFKWVNDTFGHDVGDQLLIQFVRRVKTCIREIDTLARFGGDEFAILLPGISSPENIEEMAKRILAVLQEHWLINGHEIITTSSIGISVYPSCGEDISTLMKHADQALYKAKQSGRNTYQLCDHTTEFLQRESNKSFENDIIRAIQNHEFYLVYQPKFNLTTKQIESIEALIRWEHPQNGLVMPSEFISRAEEMNLIAPITNWVLEEVGNQVKNWHSLGCKKIPVSINISPKHFEKRTLVKDVVEIINKTGLDPKNLILEITEHTIIQNIALTIETIQELKEIGLRIAIDDFGTGFSSLSYLLKLPVDIIKLDKLFIQELTNQKNSLLVHSIVTLAHNLNLRVVAEGIESENQHQLLTHYGCDIGQGYFFSKPLIGDQLQKIFL
jgi:diguanylate cyclase (GGDEF)-like protein/PAS domain S-box-containing protein